MPYNSLISSLSKTSLNIEAKTHFFYSQKDKASFLSLSPQVLEEKNSLIASSFGFDISLLSPSQTSLALSSPLLYFKDSGTNKGIKKSISIIAQDCIITTREQDPQSLREFEFSLKIVPKEGEVFDGSLARVADKLVNDVKSLRDAFKGVLLEIRPKGMGYITAGMKWKI